MITTTNKPYSVRSDQKQAKISTNNKVGLKMLNSMALEALKAKHPDIREGLLPQPKFTDKTANDLTRSIIHFLNLKGHFAERISVTGRPIDERQTFTDVLGHSRTIGRMKWIPGTGTKGSADISATVKGRSLKVEVKIHRDRQSPAQRTYQSQVEKSGGLYYIAKDFQSFYEWYQLIFE